ncbi:MAG TPA: zinc ribbon domain-containing protein [Thermomicrobiaceae bacterium]|nr:zinc ribbon domain-containing protein [Thermomicrobiaceae bacterium]
MAEPSTSPTATTARQRYHGWVLLGMLLGFGVGLAMMLADQHAGIDGRTHLGSVGDAGATLFLLAYVGLALIDWQGLVAAIAATHHVITAGTRDRAPWVAVLVSFLVFPYVIGLYPFIGVYRYGRSYVEQRRRYPLERRQRIAELEIQTGIEPLTDGYCVQCGQPLQADAQFCAFCRAPVKPVPRICPTCATVTLPGAVFCPKCGTTLVASGQTPP